MEKKYYNAKDVAELIGVAKGKAYEIIRKCNTEIKELYENKPIIEQPIIINGKVNKEYFDKKMKVEV